MHVFFAVLLHDMLEITSCSYPNYAVCNGITTTMILLVGLSRVYYTMCTYVPIVIFFWMFSVSHVQVLSGKVLCNTVVNEYGVLVSSTLYVYVSTRHGST